MEECSGMQKQIGVRGRAEESKKRWEGVRGYLLSLYLPCPALPCLSHSLSTEVLLNSGSHQ